VATQLLGEIAVVATLAMGGIANDRVGNVLQVAPDLVATTGDRFKLK
jgi:hypothetical protein